MCKTLVIKFVKTVLIAPVFSQKLGTGSKNQLSINIQFDFNFKEDNEASLRNLKMYDLTDKLLLDCRKYPLNVNKIRAKIKKTPF